MKLTGKTMVVILLATSLFSCKHPRTTQDRLGKASREDKNGWIYIHPVSYTHLQETLSRLKAKG